MYISWNEFKVLFPNVNIDEPTFNIYSEVANGLIYNYIRSVIQSPVKDVAYACGLIIQHLRAIGLQPQDKNPVSVAGISTNPKDISEHIPPPAKIILNRYRGFGI